MLAQITPCILTFNEAPNIATLVQSLPWASQIIVVDSGSDDGTLDILRDDPRILVHHRDLVSLADQWGYALDQGCQLSEWVLRLDADYVVTDDFVSELSRLAPSSEVSGFIARFGFAIHGQQLRYSFYPPKPVLLRSGRFRMYQDGHTERIEPISGRWENLTTPLVHDDRKEIARFISSQARYAPQEAERLSIRGSRHFADRTRMWGLSPIFAAAWLLLVKGLWRDGQAGLHYALQRVVAEAAIALAIVDRRLRERNIK